jgi:hypothetical protein
MMSASPRFGSDGTSQGSDMAEKSNHKEAPEGDPDRGDAILRRMLKSKPKPHKDLKKSQKTQKQEDRDK